MGTDLEDVPELRNKYQIGFKGAFENEVPSTLVEVSSFRLDRHEVSNKRYQEFLRESPQWQPDHIDLSEHNGKYLNQWTGLNYPEGERDFPVVFITWHAALAFCDWSHGRLPTEAEWEFAARAGDARDFPWGNEQPVAARANYYANDHDAPRAVGSYPPNEYGLHDMAGNVWEFLADEWKNSYQDPVAADPASRRRSVRGASFAGSVVNIRTRWRDSHVETNATEFVGFRCAYDIPKEGG